MNSSFNEGAFRDWLMHRKSLSKKASGDVVSRLNRCIKIEPLTGHESADSYWDSLLQNPVLDNIPQSSRTSMNRSARLYYEFNLR